MILHCGFVDMSPKFKLSELFIKGKSKKNIVNNRETRHKVAQGQVF